MKPITRREFLLSLLVGAGAAAISSCKPQKTISIIPTATRISEQQPIKSTPIPNNERETTPFPTKSSLESHAGVKNPTHIPQASSTPYPTTNFGFPDLVVARGGDDPEALVRRAIAGLGGMDLFVKKGAKVVIKPNICTAYHTFEYASTTNPWVVATLVKMCREAGAETVSVMDFPFGGSPEDAYSISGIKDLVEAAGGNMVLMSNFKFADTEIPLGKKLKKWQIYDEILKADVFINVPIAKDHGLAKLTLGMKNLMGVVQNRGDLHSSIGQKLADLTTRIYPTLTIIDSIRILLSGGPTGGDLGAVKKMDMIIASQDIVAADSYAATLFNIKPDSISYIKAGVEMGLGRSDINNLKVEEIAVGS